MSNSRLDGVRKGTRIPDLLLRRQSLYPTELYGPIVLKPAISRGLTPYIVFLGLDNILSEEGIIHGLLLSIYCRVGSHFSRRFELTTELLFFSRLVLALFLRRRTLYPAELQKLNWNGLPFFIGNHSIDIYYSIPKAVNPALFQNLCGPASRYFP